MEFVVSFGLPKAWVGSYKRWALRIGLHWLNYSWSEIIDQYGIIIKEQGEGEKSIWWVKNDKKRMNLALAEKIIIFDITLDQRLFHAWDKHDREYVCNGFVALILSMGADQNALINLKHPKMLNASHLSLTKHYHHACAMGLVTIDQYLPNGDKFKWQGSRYQIFKNWAEAYANMMRNDEYKISHKAFLAKCQFGLIIDGKIIWSSTFIKEVPNMKIAKVATMLAKKAGLSIAEVAFLPPQEQSKEWVFVYLLPTPHFNEVWSKEKKRIFELFLASVKPEKRKQRMRGKKFKNTSKSCFIPQAMRPRLL